MASLSPGGWMALERAGLNAPFGARNGVMAAYSGWTKGFDRIVARVKITPPTAS